MANASESTQSTAPDQWLPVGTEPQPVGNITNCVILRSEGISVVALPDGHIDAGEHPSTGLYHADTRYLSRLRFVIAGIPLTLVDATQAGNVFTTRRRPPPCRCLISPSTPDFPSTAWTATSACLLHPRIGDPGVDCTLRT